jgi:hypothetical protein
MPCRLSGQSISGQVFRPRAADSLPLAGVRVVLHQVGRETQGPVDSAVSGVGGRFRMGFAPDTSVIYLLSARYGGIEYFSAPVDQTRLDPFTAVVVYDTSSSAPLTLAARHIVIPRAGEDGSREVLDLVVLANTGLLARVAPDSVGASWTMPLPPESEGLEVGESDVSPDAVERRGDSLLLAAPIGPGEKQLSLQYHLSGAGRSLSIPVGREGGAVNVLVEESSAAVSGVGMTAADTQLIGGRVFRRWTGEVSGGTVIRVRLPGAPRAPGYLLAGLVTTAALALGLATWALLTGRLGRTRPVPVTVVSHGLIEQIATLDARYLGREAEVEAAEWSRYQDDRARLKAELEAVLATGGRSTP